MKPTGSRTVWSVLAFAVIAGALLSLRPLRSLGDLPSDCTGLNDGTPCDAQNLCLSGACNNSVCDGTFMVPASCDDGNVCTDDDCDAMANNGSGDCTHTNNSNSCDDDNLCTNNDFCSGGACSGPRIPGCTDDDGDGVDSTVEDAVPSDPNSVIQPTGDGNGDNILDSLQHNVTSLPAATGRGYITLISSCEQNLNVAAVVEASLGDDRGFEYPFGLLGFKLCNGGIDCTASCSTSNVKVIFHGATDLSAFVYRKYGPQVPGAPATTSFYDLPGVTLAGNMATFTLTDGGIGDATGVDGMIVDPSGVALGSTVAPTLNPWALGAAVLLLLSVGSLVLRRRSARSLS